MADTLITPLNDSFVDVDVIGTVHPATFTVTGESHYAAMVRDARRQRRTIDAARMDWIVVRNRLSALGSRNKRLVAEGLRELSTRLGFRRAEGLPSGWFIASLFARADRPRQSQRGDPRPRPSLAHITARSEVMSLIAALKLPLDARGQRRAAARAEWFSALERPLEVHDIIDP